MNKRKHRREPLSAHVMLLLDEGEHPLVRRGTVADISLGGIKLYLVQPLEVGAQVTLEIRFLVAGGEVKTEKVRGTTIYSQNIQDVYFVGIEFDQELNPERHPDLYGRIQDLLASD
ncbi:MAG: PilZ domain-containing protein [Nitrospirota bacterium]